jgi:hypothetical protein
MRNIFVVPIEPLDNRYTKQWYDYVPARLTQEFPEHNIVNVSGNANGYEKPQAGAFFDFASTCEYKASQAVAISQLFENGKVNQNDIFFFTDAWNHTVHTVKYISELTGIRVKCAGIWHAGWYDPTDILGFTIKNTNWVSYMEKAMYSAYDHNYFGTIQHQDKFFDQHHDLNPHSSIVCGYPLDYLDELYTLSSFGKKKKMVVFPHRLNDDKAPYIFDFIRDYVHTELKRTDVDFVKTQELGMSKSQYYEKLSEAIVVFSANRHENLGIGTFEAMMLGAYPVVPDKLSYKEMYPKQYKYDAVKNMYMDELYWRELADKIVGVVDNYDQNVFDNVKTDSKQILSTYFSCDKMIEHIRKL